MAAAFSYVDPVLELFYLFVSWLLASVPFGYAFAALYADVDLTQHGSGNIGATNANRVVGRGIGAATLAADFAKGWLPVVLTPVFFEQSWMPGLVAVVAFVGHCWTPYLDWRGGKGVATTAGGLAALAPLPVLLAAALWLGVVVGLKRSSLGALAAAVALPLLVLWLERDAFGVTLLLAVGVVLRHRENIERLMEGREHGLGA